MSIRFEADSVGTREVPDEAYYGVQSMRAEENFTITGIGMNPVFLKNLALIKKAAAITNCLAGDLDQICAKAIIKASNEVAAGKFAKEFIVDAVQGGAGTSANMNMNEVIANRANEILGGEKGAYDHVHPNDHVNMSQSTNDVVPTAGKMTVIDLMQPLLDELARLESELYAKSIEFDDVIKMGRTQLQDAVPMRLGQTFHAYAVMVGRDKKRLAHTIKEMYAVNLGGTAIGSSINASQVYLDTVVPCLARISGMPLTQADDLFDATENLDGFVAVSGALKTCAVNLSKMCNDLRLLSSGPKTGLAEIALPAKQNGSSIMPGKVNPVIPEVVTQVAFLVIGHDTTITMAAEAGQLELNAFEPVLFYNLFESITTLKGAVKTLIDNCIVGIVANRERSRDLLEQSVGIITALNPYIGYKKAAEIAKQAIKQNKSVREIVLAKKLLSAKELDQILDPYALTGSHSVPSMLSIHPTFQEVSKHS
ncbi:aspartate ammonia-lyase [Absicoccus intestinalis]|uniref:Aspartate ammonia-lyase n=1 Tax=Absicoccus intestinalis TaxID=2926319 RepID=A0ABU4WPD5_9FIRM|nr:aspartate ammonia-lyase [Absicoccus sp. CLA-KB-P134]MDX8418432.1 aspartate ammonia-lyase [Absicoccus sp. CLA-KB-P134]